MRWLLPTLLAAACCGPARAQTPPADPAAAADEQLLRDAGLKTDGPALLTYFRDRTLSTEEQDRLAAVVAGLGARTYVAREKAMKALQRAGQMARPFLEQALLSHPDPEVIRRADLCLRRLARDPESDRLAAAARSVGRQKPAGAAAVLLGYLPFAPDAGVADEVRHALTATALRDGRPEAVVLADLKDRLAVRRAAAGAALVRAGKTAATPARALLKDDDPQVRLPVALALAEAGAKDAMPVLIELLTTLPPSQRWQAEELLFRVAGEKAPPETLATGARPERVREAWTAWWKANEAKVDLAQLTRSPPTLGLTLVTQLDIMRAGVGPRRGLSGQVFEVGPDHKTRWSIEQLSYPMDAQVIAPNRVLIAEYMGRQVTERDFKGKVLWTFPAAMPIACQRLPDGRTFVATRRQVLIVDRQGKEVFTYNHPNTTISAARISPTGEVAVVGSGGLLVRVDATGRELKRYPVGSVYPMGGNLDVLPGGRVLVPQYRDNKVVEYAGDGRVVWSATVTLPISAVRLGNGNTLVVSLAQRRVIELSPSGQEVWSHPVEGRPWRARRR
jgi:hypothetical protein